MEFKKTRVKATIYGESYEIRRPTVKEAQSYAKKMKDLDDEESTGALIKMLDGLGLPEKVAFGMEADHLIQLVDALLPAKKK